MLRVSVLLRAGVVALAATVASWAVAAGVRLEDLTSTELAQRIASGATTTVLVPIGGTEQNGPHMVLGKHNRRVAVLAERVAERLGNAVVAPVLAYVPEGSIDPPGAHMRWAGTISISEAAFEGVLEGAARSLRRHGFREVVFLGDHGGYQLQMTRVATRLEREFAPQGAHVHALTEYYRVTQDDYLQALKAKGIGADEAGTHAGLADTALALAVDPALVRAEAAAARPPHAKDGATGDPRRASAELGRLGTDRIVEVSVTAIQALQRRHLSHKGSP